MSRRVLVGLLAAALCAGVRAAEDERVRAVQEIFDCLAAGLPAGGWREARAEVAEIAGEGGARTFKGMFYYLPRAEGAEPAELAPCDSREAAARIYALNQFLEPERRNWKAVRLVYTSEGRFELDYDYGR